MAVTEIPTVVVKPRVAVSSDEVAGGNSTTQRGKRRSVGKGPAKNVERDPTCQ